MAWLDKSRVNFPNGPQSPKFNNMFRYTDHGLIRATVHESQMYAATTEQAFEFEGRTPMKEFSSSHDGGEGRRVQAPLDPVESEKGSRFDNSPPRGDLYTHMNKGKEKENKTSSYKEDNKNVPRFSPPSYAVTSPVSYGSSKGQWGKEKEDYAEKNKGGPSSPTKVQPRTENTKGNEKFPISYISRNSTTTRTDPAPYETPKTECHKGTGKYTAFPYEAQPEKDEYSEKNKPVTSPSVTKIQIQPRKAPGFQKSIDGEEQGYARGKNNRNEYLPLAFNGRYLSIGRNDPSQYEPPRTDQRKGTSGNYSPVPYSAQPKKDEHNEKNKPNPYYDSSSSPKKIQVQQRKAPGFQNIIDSEKARRRYSSRANPPSKEYDDDDEEEKNSEIIDCIEDPTKRHYFLSRQKLMRAMVMASLLRRSIYLFTTSLCILSGVMTQPLTPKSLAPAAEALANSGYSAMSLTISLIGEALPYSSDVLTIFSIGQGNRLL